MRLALRLLLAFVIVAGPLAGRASAVTIKELLDYKGRLSDDILIALIESDGSVFHLSVSDVASLRDKGLSDKVIIAMLRTAHRNDPPPAPAPVPTLAPTPDIAQTAPPDVAPAIDREQMYDMQEPQPDMPVSAPSSPTIAPVQPADQAPPEPVVEYVPYPVYVPVPVAVRPHPAPAPQPVYWGWNGQRRPDSWPLTPAPAPKLDVSSPQSVAASKTGPSPATKAAVAQAAAKPAPPAATKASPAQGQAPIPPNATTTRAAAGSGTSPASRGGGG